MNTKTEKAQHGNASQGNGHYEVPGMFDGPILPLIVTMSIPVLIGMLVQVIYSITDMIWLSQINLGDSSILAGAGLIFPVGMMLFAIANGIQIGISSLLARAIGSGEKTTIGEVFSAGLNLSLVLSVITLLLGSYYGEAVLQSLGASGSIFTHAADFYYYSLPTVLPILLIGLLMGTCQGLGRTDLIMKGALMATLVNIILDPIFIFSLELGVKGAALATLVAQVLVVIYLVTALLGNESGIKVKFGLTGISSSTYRGILSVGSAQMMMQFAISGSLLFINRIVVEIDDKALTAFTLCGRIDYFILTPMFAIATALLTISGQNWGKGNIERVKEAYWVALKLAFFVVLALCVTQILLAPVIFPLFSDSTAVVHYAVLQTRILELTFPFIAVSMLASEVYQGIGWPKRSVMLTTIRHLVFTVPLSYVLGVTYDMGIVGVYIGVIVGTGVAAIVSLALMKTTPWQKRFDSHQCQTTMATS